MSFSLFNIEKEFLLNERDTVKIIKNIFTCRSFFYFEIISLSHKDGTTHVECMLSYDSSITVNDNLPYMPTTLQGYALYKISFSYL